VEVIITPSVTDSLRAVLTTVLKENHAGRNKPFMDRRLIAFLTMVQSQTS